MNKLQTKHKTQGTRHKRYARVCALCLRTFVFCLGFAFCVLFIPAAFAQISGLEFLNISADANIGDVIAALYVYGVGFVALAALIVFTAGGVKYIFAGDKDPSEAKSWMKNAFWGLVLALTSWLILYTINPALVKNVGNLQLPTISITPGSEGAKCVVGSTNPVEQCSTGFDCKNGVCTKTQEAWQCGTGNTFYGNQYVTAQQQCNNVCQAAAGCHQVTQ